MPPAYYADALALVEDTRQVDPADVWRGLLNTDHHDLMAMVVTLALVPPIRRIGSVGQEHGWRRSRAAQCCARPCAAHSHAAAAARAARRWAAAFGAGRAAAMTTADTMMIRAELLGRPAGQQPCHEHLRAGPDDAVALRSPGDSLRTALRRAASLAQAAGAIAIGTGMSSRCPAPRRTGPPGCTGTWSPRLARRVIQRIRVSPRVVHWQVVASDHLTPPCLPPPQHRCSPRRARSDRGAWVIAGCTN